MHSGEVIFQHRILTLYYHNAESKVNAVIDRDLFFLIIFLAFLAVFFVIIFIQSSLIRKKQTKIDEQIFSEPDPEPVSEYARITAKRMEEAYSGTPKMPKYKLLYIVTFLTDDNDIKEFSVSEETFNRLSEQQTGMLITIDSNFFDFGNGEEI